MSLSIQYGTRQGKCLIVLMYDWNICATHQTTCTVFKDTYTHTHTCTHVQMEQLEFNGSVAHTEGE